MRISDWSSDVCSSDLRSGRTSAIDDRLRTTVEKSACQRGSFQTRSQCVSFGHQRERKGIMPCPTSDQIDRLRCLMDLGRGNRRRSEEHTSELQSLMRISYAVFCLKKKQNTYKTE